MIEDIMIFKPGDKVLIKNLKLKDKYLYAYGINRDMCQFANKVVTIYSLHIYSHNPQRIAYKIKEDYGMWIWSLSMFVKPYEDFIHLDRYL